MWHLENIPKILHLYWGRNKKLSFMRYMTAYSFAKLNPDWEIRVYHPTKSCMREIWHLALQKHYHFVGIDYFDKLSKIKNVVIKEIDFNESLNVRQQVPEVFKSDILRWWLLSIDGGVWSDFDILYIKPIDCFPLNKKNCADLSAIICNHYVEGEKFITSVGFLMGGRGSGDLYRFIFGKAQARQTKNKYYEGLARRLWDTHLGTIEKIKQNPRFEKIRIGNMPVHAVYPYPKDFKIQDFYNGKALSSIQKDTIGLHWFAGSPETSNYDNIIDIYNINYFEFSPLLKEMANQWKDGKIHEL